MVCEVWGGGVIKCSSGVAAYGREQQGSGWADAPYSVDKPVKQ
jgi:hypothetical protein